MCIVEDSMPAGHQVVEQMRGLGADLTADQDSDFSRSTSASWSLDITARALAFPDRVARIGSPPPHRE